MSTDVGLRRFVQHWLARERFSDLLPDDESRMEAVLSCIQRKGALQHSQAPNELMEAVRASYQQNTDKMNYSTSTRTDGGF